MARILYGVMGDARGHVMRALAVARELPHHEFLFVGGGLAGELASHGFAVETVPVVGTSYEENRVDIASTVSHALRVLLFERARTIERLRTILRRFDPDLVLSDYELFLPRAARLEGRPCVGIDHQHVLTHCVHEPLPGHRLSYLMTSFCVRRLFSASTRHLVVSFFALPPVDPDRVEVFPPIIRRPVTRANPQDGDHVLVYQTSSTCEELLPVLEKTGGRFTIYGLGERARRGALEFKPVSSEGFIQDLASCRYVITNGGHNVISEALFLGKPVLAFPIANAYEQLLNAHFVERLGFGRYLASGVPGLALIEAFESRLEAFRQTVRSRDFLGNDRIVRRLEELIAASR